MKILITGSSGMIGKRLVERLGKKHTIVEFSRSNGKDITSLADVERAIKGVNIVIHAAAELDETKKEDEIYKTNVQGTRNVITAAEEEGIDQLIFLSSVGVYGETKQKLDEKSEINPQTVYERSKKEAEDLVWNMQELFPVTIIRSALVVGPNTYWKGIFKTVKKGFPLIGKGENAWQMVDVDDLADFITLCVGNEDVYNELFIVAEKQTHSLRQVVDMIAEIENVKKPGTIPKPLGIAISHVFGIQGKLTGKKPLLIPAHVKRLFKHREYDISKATKLGWKPKHSTREALQKTHDELNAKK